MTTSSKTAQDLSSQRSSLPTESDFQKDLRRIGLSGLPSALAGSLPAFSAVPSVRRAATGGVTERDEEIERLLLLAIEALADDLAKATRLYLIESRQKHKQRLEEAGEACGSCANEPSKTFERIRRTKIEPVLARELVKLAEEYEELTSDERQSTNVDEPPLKDMFEDCAEGKALYAKELAEAEQRKAAVWWPEGSSGWFGNYFSFWYKTRTNPCGQVQIVRDQGYYGAGRFGIDHKFDGGKDKLTTVLSTWFQTDHSIKAIYCGITNWDFALGWCKDHADELLNCHVRPSVFGIADRPAYPGIAGVHTLTQTADGYLLFALRSDEGVEFHKLTWSASFEESLSVEARDVEPKTPDNTVLDAIVGGLDEEWGIRKAVTDSTLLAVGREYVRVSPQRLDLSASMLAAVKLSIDLATVWRCLDNRPDIPDFDEHIAWAGVRFASRADLLQLLCFARGRTQGRDFFHDFQKQCNTTEIEFYQGGRSKNLEDKGLMPTSAARLYLGSLWLGI